MISVPTNVTCAADVFYSSSHRVLPHRSRTMILPSQSDSGSIFADGKLKAGIYKIQNIAGHTFLDIRENSLELCCRPVAALEGKGFVSLYPQSLPYHGNRSSSVGNSPSGNRIFHTQGMIYPVACRFPCRELRNVMQLEPGGPDQFCNMLKGLESESVVSVTPYPAAWRIQIVEDERFIGSEYVR